MLLSDRDKSYIYDIISYSKEIIEIIAMKVITVLCEIELNGSQ
jgi:hypothetical protein